MNHPLARLAAWIDRHTGGPSRARRRAAEEAVIELLRRSDAREAASRKVREMVLKQIGPDQVGLDPAESERHDGKETAA